MKPDTSRKKLFGKKLHEKKSLLHVHVSKALKARMKTKKRALLVKKGDRVRVMRGSFKGKEGKVAKVNYGHAVLFIEGLTARTARGKEAFIPFQPSNLMLMNVEMSGSRKGLFSDAKVAPKEEKPAEAKQAAGSDLQAAGSQQPAASSQLPPATGHKPEAASGKSSHAHENKVQG